MMIFKKVCGLALVAAVAGILGGCMHDGETVVLPNGQTINRIPPDVFVLPDHTLHVVARDRNESLLIADTQDSTYHCTPHCRPTGGGMVGSGGAAPILSSLIGAAGQIGFGLALGNGGNGGGVSTTFNNSVSGSVASSIKNNGGNNAGIGNSKAIVANSGNSFNVNKTTSGANAQTVTGVSVGGKH